MEVGSLMTRKVCRVHWNTGIRRVAEIMRANGIGAVPVEQDGRLVGMLTDRDIVTAIIGNGARRDQRGIGRIAGMIAPPEQVAFGRH
ncbi:CBS domain-containing protein [Ruegeria marina]|uniref:CBS domain-containing protein n=1 Tax=Ruegeria marina TaxID=639004 RepID=A0A1G6I9D8_9RHOB|nr:CBS domain-containing protein [Ruegeria marina]SDC03050.1 CBS domain-containing protein [Ruegeria marina]